MPNHTPPTVVPKEDAEKAGVGEVILVVDDSRDNRKILSLLLQRNGYQTIEAENGRLALETLSNQTVDLVLLDVMMPELDGFEVCLAIRQETKWPNLPIIFLTAIGDQESIHRGLTIGGDDYVVKPFDKSELLARVHNHVKFRKGQKALEASIKYNNELIHILSHDLSNPLSTIVSLADIITEEPDSTSEFAPKISDLAQSTLELIGLIKNMRALESKGVELSPVNLTQSVMQSAGFNKERAQSKGITFKYLNLDRPIVIQAEPVSLVHSVLNNLLTNGIKFSHPGSTIEILASNKDEQVQLTITDHGIGMSEKLQEQVFDISKKTSRIGTANEAGTGFGMPLVKQFMQYYGGSIHLESAQTEPGQHQSGTSVILLFQPG